MVNTAENIIDRFGGISALARALGHKHPTTVQGWKDRGVIPARQQAVVLKAAQREEVKLTYADFFGHFQDDRGGPGPDGQQPQEDAA